MYTFVYLPVYRWDWNSAKLQKKEEVHKFSAKRDNNEADLNAFLIGEAIKQAREARNLTQEQLGELMGVKRAQISKIESGKSISFSTIVRAFKAMGVNTASLDLGSLGRVALW